MEANPGVRSSHDGDFIRHVLRDADFYSSPIFIVCLLIIIILVVVVLVYSFVVACGVATSRFCCGGDKNDGIRLRNSRALLVKDARAPTDSV